MGAEDTKSAGGMRDPTAEKGAGMKKKLKTREHRDI
jgi:hypothetical protein